MMKIKVSREVADAIEDVKIYYSNFAIIKEIVEDNGCSAYGTKMRVLINFAKYDSDNADILIQALVNGYEVEETPEEKWSKIYRQLGSTPTDGTTYYYSHAPTRFKTIEEMARDFGLKIEGVNAN